MDRPPLACQPEDRIDADVEPTWYRLHPTVAVSVQMEPTCVLLVPAGQRVVAEVQVLEEDHQLHP